MAIVSHWGICADHPSDGVLLTKNLRRVIVRVIVSNTGKVHNVGRYDVPCKSTRNEFFRKH
ncbi:hypothetical protein RMSM_02223 [Rhodopirellula maiorica SM1]|uniref:Uncharacterized protein n=1 Tax=Rhodopirellula maiorica SM1 TaxID=1265738 RepID=M5S3V3_9BACT|nr:hypothetical protein RMSM_02223 [Rhodopirellula maiorica SM1]